MIATAAMIFNDKKEGGLLAVDDGLASVMTSRRAKACAAPDKMRVLLITNNVGRLFDARDDSLIWWINVLDDTITAAAADFVAIHLQKLAGNGVAQLADAVRSRFHDYWCSGLFCPSASDPDFTALGCIVLVRRSLARDVAVFDLSAGQSGGWKPITTLDEPLVPHPALSERWCRHSTFPRHMFDARSAVDAQGLAAHTLESRWSSARPTQYPFIPRHGPSPRLAAQW